MPSSSRTGHTFTAAATPASTPAVRVRVVSSMSAATARAVTNRSYRDRIVGPSSGTPTTHSMAPYADLPRRRNANATASATTISTKNACVYDHQDISPGSISTPAAPGGYCHIVSSTGNVPVLRTSNHEK
ncbi:hypothetical protein GCM10023205_15740 [Yinghuangia aomiensis]|uniref:Uncharacterized protein n=1 Tax=Yinghuangia aomiensis TaxID=676205 RepID=A0ABP9GZB8_9ACTN